MEIKDITLSPMNHMHISPPKVFIPIDETLSLPPNPQGDNSIPRVIVLVALATYTETNTLLIDLLVTVQR